MHPSPFQPQRTPARSAIPRTIGILAIIFACIGLGGSILFSLGPLSDVVRWRDDAEQLGFIVTWLYLWAALSMVLFVLHLVGGILACTYRPIGLRLLTAYAVGALILVVLDLVLLNGYVSGWRFRESLTIPRSIFALVALPWPIVVLALVNGRRAKQACTTQPPAGR